MIPSLPKFFESPGEASEHLGDGTSLLEMETEETTMNKDTSAHHEDEGMSGENAASDEDEAIY